MTNAKKPDNTSPCNLVFLGSSGCIQVPSFHCSCDTCQAARQNASQERTRASVALIGRETVVIDTSPDVELQLERQSIRQVHRVFITHWHYDHVGGLGALAEPSSHIPWPPVEVYLPRQVAYHMDQELAYMKRRVNVHAIEPGDRIDLPDATWEVVKTTHTEDSVGFIVRGAKSFAYLVDSVMPPPQTMARLTKLDLVILEATFDELDEQWPVPTTEQAVGCWRQIGTKECILTHVSCHSWRNKRLIAGISHEQRRAYQAKNPGLRFAYDGMTVAV